MWSRCVGLLLLLFSRCWFMNSTSLTPSHQEELICKHNHLKQQTRPCLYKFSFSLSHPKDQQFKPVLKARRFKSRVLECSREQSVSSAELCYGLKCRVFVEFIYLSLSPAHFILCISIAAGRLKSCYWPPIKQYSLKYGSAITTEPAGENGGQDSLLPCLAV